MVSLAAGALFLSGCAGQYVVVLTDGQRLAAAEKPRLEQSSEGQFDFVFTGLDGKTNFIPSGRVRAVAPASQLKPAH